MDSEPTGGEDQPLITPASVSDRNATPTTPTNSVIPTMITVTLLGASLLALLLTIVLGHSTTTFPRIVQCGTKSPESFILGLGFVGLGGFFVRMSRLAFNFISGSLPDSQASHLSLALCILCAFSAFGIAVAPLSKFETPATLDEMLCILCLAFSLLCVLLHLAALRNDSSSSQSESIPSWKSLLVGVGVVAAVASVSLRFTQLDVVRSALEWVCLLTLGFYMGSMSDKITDDVVRNRPRITERDAKAVV
eukprot:c2625_g1_i1.p1 GENE.c2625_g1_i1~~c2625_g1_i1.p1  ORF type:complete len:250 (-),score=41.45 c2625_g1_i1:67-816(-)